jgi:prepilin-type N-terminal cleavage/methylation domain-containing protein
MRYHRRKSASPNSGFTLLEMLIYILIIGVILVAVTGFSFQFLATRAKASALQETERNAQLAAARIAAEVREAQDLDVPGSTFSANPSTLSLILADGTKSPTIFSVSGGVLRVKQGTGAVLPLTSSKVQVSEFVIDNLSTANGKDKSVRIHIKTSFLTDLGIYTADSTVETTAQVKKADGFAN